MATIPRKRNFKEGQSTIELPSCTVILRHNSPLLGNYQSQPRLGSKEFVTAIAQISSISITMANNDAFLIRSEKRGSKGVYWYAFMKFDGKVFKRYLGLAKTITRKTLEDVHAKLLVSIKEWSHATENASRLPF